MLVAEIAQYLAARGLVTFDEQGADGDCFVGILPAVPDEAVALFPTGGDGADLKLAYDQPTVQVLVRGTRDPRAAADRAQAIYGALHGLHGLDLPGGTYVIGCWGIQSGTTHLGRDANGRHELSLNFRLEIRSRTTYRDQ